MCFIIYEEKKEKKTKLLKARSLSADQAGSKLEVLWFIDHPPNLLCWQTDF